MVRMYSLAITVGGFLMLSVCAMSYAQQIDFIPIKDGYTHGEQNNVYTVKEDDITIPEKGGIISTSPVTLKSGLNIELSLKSAFDIYQSENEQWWVQVLHINFYSDMPKADIKTINDPSIATLEKPGTNIKAIKFYIGATTFEDKRYAGNKYEYGGNSLHSDYPSVNEINKVYHTPLKWNRIKISVVNEKLIKVFVNDNEALIYKGDFPKTAFLGIGNNCISYPLLLNRTISINGKPSAINLNY